MPLSQADIWREQLGARVIVAAGQGHFDEESGVTEPALVYEQALRLLAI